MIDTSVDALRQLPRTIRYVINLPPPRSTRVPRLHVLIQPQPDLKRHPLASLALCGQKPNDENRWFRAWDYPPNPANNPEKLKLCTKCVAERDRLDGGNDQGSKP